MNKRIKGERVNGLGPASLKYPRAMLVDWRASCS